MIRKSLTNSNVTAFQIDTRNCFDLELTTSTNDELIVEALIDGEYSDDLVVKIREAGSTYMVSTGFRPNFVVPNDKLSAHKVISIALKVRLPEFNKVHVTGTNCNVMAKGTFSILEVALDDGNCSLDQVGLKAVVKTQSGNINVLGEGGNVLAESKYGTVVKKNFPEGASVYDLHSVRGDIHLTNTN
ncbi:hypothetical protein [Muriicola sp. Z0-33]|uniref:hypothetical protein n=1 Tax=Muriicola sp. Z0-33 TaxID=2816957 RepID=UPI00223736AA|nr:hypothetical protein [Muriicola sp. Z0-33]MCW5514906.1 hypothetical protein [Muriicola sp. Z0-33]